MTVNQLIQMLVDAVQAGRCSSDSLVCFSDGMPIVDIRMGKRSQPPIVYLQEQET